MASDAEASTTGHASPARAPLRLGVVGEISRLTGLDTRFLAMLAALLVITYWPWLTLALPRALGLI